MKKIILLFTLVIFGFGIEIGSVVPQVVLSKKDGGLVSGGAFDLSSLRGKVYLLVYSDPDKRDLNEEFFEKVKAKNFDRSKYGSVAIINMAATWMPNFLLNAILKKKQKKFPQTIYVKDNRKVLVKKWGLADQNQDIVIIDKEGRVVFYKAGKLSPKEQERALEILTEKIQND